VIPKRFLDDFLSLALPKLLDVYNPQAVYLFGSHAWGDPDEKSDIDVFIILSSSDLRQAERIRIGMRALIGTNIDVDLLVFTQEEVAQRKDDPSTLVHKILVKGKRLYEAA
jgi:uncharacterized protein